MEPIRRQLLGKTGPATNSSSRTISDFSSRGTSNGAEADDERVSSGSGHSFEEINLVEGKNSLPDKYPEIERKDSPQDLFEELGGKHSPQDEYLQFDRENSPQDQFEEVGRKDSPQDLPLDIERKDSLPDQLSGVDRRSLFREQLSEDLSSVDLGSYPASGRVDKPREEDPDEEIERGFDLLNFEENENAENKSESEECNNEFNQNENHKDRTEPDDYSNDLNQDDHSEGRTGSEEFSTDSSKIPTGTVSFKLGCTSSSSGTECTDELEPHSMHPKSPLYNAVSVEPISESENDVSLDNASTETPRGADTRSVSVFNNVLQ